MGVLCCKKIIWYNFRSHGIYVMFSGNKTRTMISCVWIYGKGPSINDITPAGEGRGGLQKLVIWGDFQGISGVTRGGGGVKKLKIGVMSFMDELLWILWVQKFAKRFSSAKERKYIITPFAVLNSLSKSLSDWVTFSQMQPFIFHQITKYVLSRRTWIHSTTKCIWIQSLSKITTNHTSN